MRKKKNMHHTVAVEPASPVRTTGTAALVAARQHAAEVAVRHSGKAVVACLA